MVANGFLMELHRFSFAKVSRYVCIELLPAPFRKRHTLYPLQAAARVLQDPRTDVMRVHIQQSLHAPERHTQSVCTCTPTAPSQTRTSTDDYHVVFVEVVLILLIRDAFRRRGGIADEGRVGAALAVQVLQHDHERTECGGSGSDGLRSLGAHGAPH